MNIKKRLVFGFLLIACLTWYYNTHKIIEPIYANIDVIDVSYVSYISPIISPETTIREYRIELNKSMLWYFFIKHVPNPTEEGYVSLDDLTKNKDYVFISNLDDNAIKTFLYASSNAGFVDWEEHYPGAPDCPVWQIAITFSDGTFKEIYVGAYNYPDTWDDMYKAFYTMTGLEILYKANVVIHPVDDYPIG